MLSSHLQNVVLSRTNSTKVPRRNNGTASFRYHSILSDGLHENIAHSRHPDRGYLEKKVSLFSGDDS